MLLASLPEQSRVLGSSVSTVVFNVLGNFMGPIFCGWVTDRTGSLGLGVQLILAVSTIGVLPMGVCVWLTRGMGASVPGRNSSLSRQQSSSDVHYTTVHNDSMTNIGTNVAGTGGEQMHAFGKGTSPTRGVPADDTSGSIPLPPRPAQSFTSVLASDPGDECSGTSPVDVLTHGFNQHTLGMNIVSQIRHLSPFSRDSSSSDVANR